MNYRDKLRESQDRAHSQAVATKILAGLEDLRSKVSSSPTASRRWIWELIQNAKDVHPTGAVKIEVEFAGDSGERHVTFRHTGMPFTINSMRFLIEQISTKNRSIDESGKRKTTGKFGTGFLTTHLLSSIVNISGVLKEPDLDARTFSLTLDRSGTSDEEIIAAVLSAEEVLANLDAAPAAVDYVEGNINTVFKYILSDETSLRVAQTGIQDLYNCLPYSLLFVSEIDSVHILPHSRVYQRADVHLSLSVIPLASVKIEEGVETAHFSMLHLSKDLTTIAVPVRVEGESVSLLPIGPKVPRLFCDFPLVGTEDFPFPAVINNPNFNPTDPRDGIFLSTTKPVHPSSEENKQYIRDAAHLYMTLLENATKDGWDDLHYLVQIPAPNRASEHVDQEWYRKNITDPIKERLLSAPIVRTASGALRAMVDEKGEVALWFPHGGEKAIREKIWRCINQWSPSEIPRLEDVEFWYPLSWPERGRLTLSKVAEFVERLGTLEKLSSELQAGVSVFDWLNSFYALLTEDKQEYNTIINQRSLFPNQNGDFCQKTSLYRESGEIRSDFKDILQLLGSDIREELIDTRVQVDLDAKRSRNMAYVVNQLTVEIDQKSNDRETAKQYSKAFRRILLYFQREPTEAQRLFPSLYKRKHILYDDEEILANLGKAEQLADLMEEFKVKNIESLRGLIARGADPQKSLLPKTEEIILAMGITSLEEWQKVLENDIKLAERFSHESTPTTELFVYVQGLIRRAKERVLIHLRGLTQYDLTFADETAPTIIAGVQKNGQMIQIAIRPALDGQVIIYYRSELDVLDYETSELWVVDNLDQVRRISLGHILRTGQIVKFPI